MPSYSKKVPVPGKSASEIYDQISKTIDQFMDKAKLAGCEVGRDTAAKTVRFKHSMVSGEVRCSDGMIDVEAKLSLLATPFKSKIDDGIQKWLAKTFSTS